MIRDLRSGNAPWVSGRCLVYARCSTQAQDASIPDQLETIERERKLFGLEPVCPSFFDDGLKGHDETRPGLRSILEFVRTHPNPVRRNSDFIPILVYDVSRFGRFDDPKKVFAYFVEVERYGYEFYSVTERIRSRGNIADFVQLIIKGEQAYDYSVNLSKYAMRTACQLAQKGWWPGGTPPYGYDRVTYGPDGKPKYQYVTMPDKSVRKYTLEGSLVETLLPVQDKGKSRSPYSDKLKGDRVRLAPGDPDRVKVVQEIYSAFAEEGKGLKRIARGLNARGVPPPRGRAWIPLTVRAILRNPAYRGSLVYGRRSDGKHHWLEIERTEEGYSTRIERKDVPGRVFVHRSVEECIVVDDCHPAIVAPELWEKAQERLRIQKEMRGHADTRSGRGAGSSYILSGDGLMKCRHCGYSFQGKTDPRNGLRYYYDSGYERGGTSVCRCTYVPAQDVERWVFERIEDRWFGGMKASPGALRTLEEEIASRLDFEALSADGRPGVRDLEKRLQEKRKRLALIVRELDEETIGMVREELARLRAEIRTLEAELEGARRRQESGPDEDPQSRAREIASRILDFKRVLEAGSPDERKEFIRCFVAGVEVDGEKGEVAVAFYAPLEGRDGFSCFWEWCPQRESNPCRGLEKPVS